MYNKGDKATIIIETSKHFKEIKSVYVNKKKIDGKKIETLNDSGNYFLEFVIEEVKEDINIVYPRNDFYELSYDVRVIPDESYAGTYKDQVNNIINKSTRANFLYGFKIIKDGEILKDTKNNMETFGSFFDEITYYNKNYKAGDIIEVYVKNSYKDEFDNSKYGQYLTNFASRSYGRTKKYPLDVSYDSESNITTYRLVVEDSVAFEILGFSYSDKVSNRVVFDGINLESDTYNPYDSEPINSFKIYNSSNEEIVNLVDVEKATTNDFVRIEVEFDNNTYKNILNALKNNLTLNGEKIKESDYEITSEGKLIINNVKAPYDYDSSYRGYYNANEIGFCYQIELNGVKEYVESSENFRKINFKKLVLIIAFNMRVIILLYMGKVL